MARAARTAGGGSFASRIAHYECEIAAGGRRRAASADEADAALQRAREVAPQAPRPLRAGRPAAAARRPAAPRRWPPGTSCAQRHAGAFLLVAADYAAARRACGQADAARAALLESRCEQLPARRSAAGAGLARRRRPRPPSACRACWRTCSSTPRCRPRQLVLDAPPSSWTTPSAWPALRDAVARAAQPLQRYRCAACGFEAQHYFWQCPGCLSWDSYPPQRIDAL